MSRKRTLVDHGFRLPSAMDNRPLRWEEFLERIGQTVYLSATPGPYELRPRRRRRRADHPADRPGRPGDRGQADQGPDRRPAPRDPRARRAQRARAGHHADQEDVRGPHRLPARARASGCATCTPRSTPCAGSSCCASCAWASSTCSSASTCCARASTCPRCRSCRILDADKEGFLRSATSLIQTIGRAARNVSGQVHMYADKITRRWRRRSTRPTGAGPSRSPTTSSAGVDPQPLRKRIADITDLLAREDADTEAAARRVRAPAEPRQGAGAGPRLAAVTEGVGRHAADLAGMPRAALADLIQQLNDQMHAAAAELQFELAARLRDEIGELKKELRGMDAAGVR